MHILPEGLTNEIGAGIGLIICKEFIKKPKGDIKIEGELGRVSKEVVSFPTNHALIVENNISRLNPNYALGTIT